MSKYTIGSLFSGIGGIDIAFQYAGFDIAWQVEIDEYCQQVLAKNFPSVQRYDDVCTVRNLPHVDVITAGFPCQPFSIAGKQLGSDDERFVIPDMLRVIQEVRPSVVFLENVPHFAKINDGYEFKQLLKWFAENGYDAQWQHIRASDAGAPHRRERWFCVAYIPNSDSKRCKEHGAGGEYISYSRPTERSLESLREAAGVSVSSSEPRLDGDVDGLPYRLDRHQFPAGFGQEQLASEPPRVTETMRNHRNRLIALGNAVVPQVIYPTALSILEYLES